LGVTEDVIGFADFLELRLRRLVVRVDVGVQLAGKLPISLLDLFFVRLPANPQMLIVVLSHSTMPLNPMSLLRSSGAKSFQGMEALDVGPWTLGLGRWALGVAALGRCGVAALGCWTLGVRRCGVGALRRWNGLAAAQ